MWLAMIGLNCRRGGVIFVADIVPAESTIQ